MMNPVTVGFLSQLERQKHARQIRVFQLQNQAHRVRQHRRSRLKRTIRWLASLLVGAGLRLQSWSGTQDQQIRA